MNLTQLWEFRPQLDELRVIGRGVAEGEAVSELVGMTRKGGSVRLYALQFDGEAHEARQLAEEQALCRVKRRPRDTRRQEQFGGLEIEDRFPFGWLRSIRLGNRTLAIGGGSSGPVSERDWRKILLLEEFLRRGYRPCEAIACRGLSSLTLTEYRVEGEYRRIPLPKEPDSIEVTTSADAWANRCRRRMRLTVGQTYPRPHVLTDGRTGETHRFYIEGVSLTDVWEEAEHNFQDPRLLERMTAQELEEMKRRHLGALSQFCPRGMRIPVVEYEAEEGISLEFFQTEWLDAPRDPPCEGSATGMIFLMKADKKTGRHGLPLKASAVHCPVPEDTAVLNLELLRWSRREQERTLLL